MNNRNMLPSSSPAGAQSEIFLMHAGLGAMLGTVTEEQLHEVLAALETLVDADAAAAAAAEPGISPGVLAVWERNVTDPLVVVSALDLLQALAKIPDCLASLQVRCCHIGLDFHLMPVDAANNNRVASQTQLQYAAVVPAAAAHTSTLAAVPPATVGGRVASRTTNWPKRCLPQAFRTTQHGAVPDAGAGAAAAGGHPIGTRRPARHAGGGRPRPSGGPAAPLWPRGMAVFL
jgi:hypothetical protein